MSGTEKGMGDHARTSGAEAPGAARARPRSRVEGRGGSRSRGREGPWARGLPPARGPAGPTGRTPAWGGPPVSTTARRLSSRVTVGVAALLVALVALAPGVGAYPPGPSAPASASPAASTTVYIVATASFSFLPGSFVVTPGETVHLVVNQTTTTAHTLTISSLVDFSLPSSDSATAMYAFFHAHPPLANLSLGSTAGGQNSTTFTAPIVQGTYEFLCEIHYSIGMVGTMTDSNSTAAVSGGGGPSTAELVAIGAVVALALIAGIVVVVRRRHRAP